MRRVIVLSFVLIAFVVIAFSNGNYANAQTVELDSLWEKYYAVNSEYNAKLDALLNKFVAEHETALAVLKVEFDLGRTPLE